MAADPARLSDAINAQIADQALRYATPGSIPYIQHSAYLADALNQMRAHGGDNIRTSGALGSNLLAEALLQYSQRKAGKQLLTQENADRAAALNAATYGLEPPAAADAGPGGQAGGAEAQATPAASAPPPPAATAQAPSLAGPAPDWDAVGKSHDMLVRAVMGEDHNGAGQQAATSVIMNRAQDAGIAPDQVIGARHQFEPFGNKATWNRLSAVPTDAPAYQHALGNVDQVLNHGSTTNADHFYGPQAQAQFAAADGRSPVPAWDDGSGQKIGGNLYFHQGYNPHSGIPPMLQSPGYGAMAQGGGQPGPQGQAPSPQSMQVSNGPGPSMPAPQGGPQGAPQASPFQVASNGPIQAPSAPAGPMGGQMPPQGPPQAPGGPQGPMAGPMQPHAPQFGQQGWTPPPVPINPGQWQQLQRLKQLAQQYPQMYGPQLQQFADGLRAQQTKPEELDISRPNDAGQITVTGKTTGQVYGVRSPDGVMIAAGPKMMINNPQGGQGPTASAVQSTMPTQDGSFARGTVTERDIAGHRTVVQAPQFNAPDQVMSQQKDFLGGNTYQDTLHIVNAVNSLQRILAAAKGNNGLVGMSALDNLLQAQTGLSAKQGAMQMLLEHQGVPQEIRGAIDNLFGKGGVTPDTINQALSILRQYGNAHLSSAQNELQQRNGLMSKLSGGQFSDIGVQLPQLDPMPAVPWLNAGGAGGAPQPQPGAQPPPPPRDPSVPQNAPPGTRRRADGRYFFQQNGGWFEWRPGQ